MLMLSKHKMHMPNMRLGADINMKIGAYINMRLGVYIRGYGSI